MDYFPYGEQEINRLKQRDKKLGAAIDRLGFIRRDIEPDLFKGLITAIISQQISSKTARTIAERVTGRAGDITPQTISEFTDKDLRSCGLSGKKVLWIKNAARAALAKKPDFAELCRLSDDEVISALSSLPGIGKWTAEMLLIFSLGRPDILSANDFGIRKGIKKLYDLPELPSLKEVEKYRKRYSPYATVASFYLWEVVRQT